MEHPFTDILIRIRIAKEPALSKAYYQAIQQIYWRREAVARAILGGSL